MAAVRELQRFLVLQRSTNMPLRTAAASSSATNQQHPINIRYSMTGVARASSSRCPARCRASLRAGLPDDGNLVFQHTLHVCVCVCVYLASGLPGFSAWFVSAGFMVSWLCTPCAAKPSSDLDRTTSHAFPLTLTNCCQPHSQINRDNQINTSRATPQRPKPRPFRGLRYLEMPGEARRTLRFVPPGLCRSKAVSKAKSRSQILLAPTGFLAAAAIVARATPLLAPLPGSG